MQNPAAQPQWVLDKILEIDRHAPGFCGAFFRASPEKRQVMALYLSACPNVLDLGPDLANLGQWLASSKHAVILARVNGKSVLGLRGALRRSGPVVHEQRFYAVLMALLTRPKHAAIRTCIARLSAIDMTRLRVANILPVAICRANVVEAIGDVATACRLAVALKLLVSAGAEQEALLATIGIVRDDNALRKAIRRAILMCHAPEHPVEATVAYRPIRSPKELHKAAAKFRNCARGYSIELLDQEAPHAFAVFRHFREEAIIHLRRRSGQWFLQGIFGPRNFRPSPALREEAEKHLCQHGIRMQERGNPKSAWDAVRDFTRAPFFDVDYA